MLSLPLETLISSGFHELTLQSSSERVLVVWQGEWNSDQRL
jgi:hypothetical protein